jgi:3'-phosphoadenosine 5'-phosphosulfate sulfotransferase (PAPS reductase)/FAD synthetase
MQSMPLDVKIRMTQHRVKLWVDEYGEENVYISFSGGKDSTVLLNIVREKYPDMLAVFVDTGLEYPEIREFVKTFANVVWLKPKKTFRTVIEEYGYPFISKEVSDKVYKVRSKPDGSAAQSFDPNSNKIQKYGARYDYSKWGFLIDAPFKIGANCCNVMKKNPVKCFEHKTGMKGITAQMASESSLRTTQWLKYGCNAFDKKRPISNPMSFWTEQDILRYIKENNLLICSVYGEIIEESNTHKLVTTGCNRTGCMFCGYGCHREKPGEGRFLRMKETHPQQYDYIMRPWNEEITTIDPKTGKEITTTKTGLNYKEVIDWINSHGNFNIEY